MSITFALDVYGTLIDPLQVTEQLVEHVGDAAPALSELWRSKQLEYSFRRGLMGEYVPFSVVTRAALDYACNACSVNLSEEAKSGLMQKYRMLSAFKDVRPALGAFQDSDASFHAFSNGQSKDVIALLAHAKIEAFITSIVSVDQVQTFKPDPRVYAHFNKVTSSTPEETWLISSNPFDIIGAAACGWNTAWLNRKGTAVFDPWEYQPSKTINSLSELELILG